MKKLQIGGKAKRKWAWKGVSVEIFAERRLLIELGSKPRRSRKWLAAGVMLSTTLIAVLTWQALMFAGGSGQHLAADWLAKF